MKKIQYSNIFCAPVSVFGDKGKWRMVIRMMFGIAMVKNGDRKERNVIILL